MEYKYEMYFNDVWNDVSAYVETNAPLGDRLNKTLNIGSFIFAHIRADKFDGIDLSEAVKPYIPVKVTINVDEDVFRFYTADCTRIIVKKTDTKLYRHDINLIETAKILQRKTIPDSTVTQPKSTQFTSLYSSEQKSVEETIDNDYTIPTLVLINESTNTSVVEGNVLKAGHVGQVIVTLDIKNYQHNKKFSVWQNYIYSDGEVELRAEIYVNGDKKFEDEFFIPATGASLDGNWWDTVRHIVVDTPTVYTKSLALTLDKSGSDQTITVKLKTLGVWHWQGVLVPTVEVDDEVDVTTYLTLGGDSGEGDAYVYLSEEVEKCLRTLDIRDLNDTTPAKYVLDASVDASLKGILSPEFTFTNYKAWDKLEKIANVVNAIPEIKEDFKTITFRYLDEIPDLQYDQSMFKDETQAYALDSYVSGLEINSPNVVEEDILLNAKIEPYEDGWMTVRTSDNLTGQLTDDNAVFKTRQLIQKIYKLLVKGVGVKIEHDTEPDITLYGNSDTLDNETSASYWDISSRIVRDDEWNVYPNTTQNKTDSARTGINTRGNNLSFTQGQNLIKGLGHTTLTVSDIVGTTLAPRALFETIMAKCAELLATDATYSGYNIVTATDSEPEKALLTPHNNYEDVLYRIYYVPLINARTTVYKHNTFNSESFLIDFINEQDKLNDTDNLGKFVTTTLNRQGNLEYTVTGEATNYTQIPKVSYKTYDDLVVVSRDLNLNKNLILYTLQLSKDFINRSSYVGRESAYRAFEIPNTDIVHRQDKYTEFMVLTKDVNAVLPSGYSIMSVYAKQMFTQNFCNLAGANTKPISYGKIDVTPTVGDSPTSYDMPINPYALGTTINLQLEFDTNYSAGTQMTEETIGGVDAKMQRYIHYTNKYGQIYSIKANLYPRGKVDNDEADADLFPEYSNVPTDNKVVELEMIINKDAREKYGINIEFPVISSDSSVIRTYPGIAKYSGMLRPKDTINVRFALLRNGFFPTVNTVKLDTTQALITTDVGVSVYDSENEVYGIEFNNVTIPAGVAFEGYVLYELDTKELIYAVKEEIVLGEISYTYDTDTIWFVPKKDLKDSTRPTE